MASLTRRRSVVAQLGARRHYAVPRILDAGDRLELLFTDFRCPGWLQHAAGVIPESAWPALLRRLTTRVPQDLPASRIVDFKSLALRYRSRLRAASTPSAVTATHLWAGSAFCRRVRDRLPASTELVYTFNSAGLELLEECSRRGIRGIVEQTLAPRSIERQLLDRESDRFPDWDVESSSDAHLEAFSERELREWEQAELVICGSDFVQQSIQQAGGPVEKCRVVPYGGDFTNLETRAARRDGPLRILTVGAVGLRKGSPYVFQTARKLSVQADFKVVGHNDLARRGPASLPDKLELVGSVARDRVGAYYRWADVFFLPSHCEGSAMATYEALAFGLPVVCTTHTGSVVRDGVEGFIVPIRDVGAMVEALERLADDRDLLQAMSDAAIRRSREYSLARYGERLLRALDGADRDSESDH